MQEPEHRPRSGWDFRKDRRSAPSSKRLRRRGAGVHVRPRPVRPRTAQFRRFPEVRPIQRPVRMGLRAWHAVRVLSGPPRTLSNREVSLRLPKGPQLAGSDVGVSVSVETFSGLEAILGELSLALGIPFPGNGDRCQQRRGSNVSTVQSNPASDAAATIRREGRRAGPRPFRGGAAHRSPP